MDTNFRIIWVEDVDEWYNTLSRRLTRYIKSKNFKIIIDRVKDSFEFDIKRYNIQNYDLLVIDYELEKKYIDGIEQPTYGHKIIKMIRDGQFYNDVLFYSSHGFNIILDVMKKEGLQGVFIADRNNEEFIDTAKALVDKAVRRSENLVNIRGIVMDNTSDFDNKIRDIISIIWPYLKEGEEKIVNNIKKKILADNKKTAEKLVENYSIINAENIDQLLNERDFSAYRQARLLGWCINSNMELKNVFKDIFRKYLRIDIGEGDIPFFEYYMKDIINYRNALAHVKVAPDGMGECYIGEIDGKSVKFDEELCSKIRASLISYESILDDMYQYIEENM